MSRLKSHTELMGMAWDAAVLSPDPSTQNGAILATQDGRVIHTTAACNEFPRGVHYKVERWERPLKYSIIEHAERNSIYAAARHGIKTDGLVMYCVWATCTDCARALIQAGVHELVTFLPPDDEAGARWAESIDLALTMLDEGGVRISFLDSADFAHVKPILRNGDPWTPCS